LNSDGLNEAEVKTGPASQVPPVSVKQAAINQAQSPDHCCLHESAFRHPSHHPSVGLHRKARCQGAIGCSHYRATGKTVNIVVATSRGRDEKTGSFDNRRANTLSYQALTISMPPGHQPGEIEWQRMQQSNPAKDFVALQNRPVDRASFEAALAALVPPSGEVFLFIHG
jgi:esterase/lipase superfamily enzyme